MRKRMIKEKTVNAIEKSSAFASCNLFIKSLIIFMLNHICLNNYKTKPVKEIDLVKLASFLLDL